MGFLFVFLLKANVVFTVLFVIYCLLLRKEKLFAGNRFALLFIFLLSVTIPLCPGFDFKGLKALGVPGTHLTDFYTLSALQKGTYILDATETLFPRLYIISILLTTYLSVLGFLLIRFIVKILQVIRVVKNSRKREMNGLVYCEPACDLPPFSFFRHVVIKPDTLNPEQYRDILAHESCHGRQLHSIDVFVAELACILFWFNPFMYAYRNQVKLNLEFIADEHVLRSGADRKAYQLNMVSFATRNDRYSLTNAFGASKIKQRIGMMNAEPASSGKRYRYVAGVPVIILLYLVMNTERIISREILIDAVTSTVRFTEGPVADRGIFKGVYVLNDRIYTDEQIRELLSERGQLEFIFNEPPVLGFYTPNDAHAMQKWGEAAKDGVVFLKPKNTLQN